MFNQNSGVVPSAPDSLSPQVERGCVKATASAYIGARELGIINFYKSMTTHTDHRIWQDVYHVKTCKGDLVYLKLTVMNVVLIISFKEL